VSRPVYIVTIKLAIHADDIADAKAQAAFAGKMLVPLATAAQPGHHPVAVGITPAHRATGLCSLNEGLSRTSDRLDRVIGAGGAQ
jgi:hypothetical protein